MYNHIYELRKIFKKTTWYASFAFNDELILGLSFNCDNGYSTYFTIDLLKFHFEIGVDQFGWNDIDENLKK